jgi:D-inositol-3-phosphate glycosyltransferase
VPIDSPVEPSPSLMWLSRLDALAVYTCFARDSLRNALAVIGGRTPPTYIVPHGRCASTFFPIDATPSQARAQARAALHLPEDAFIVLNANRNQPRKRIDLTLLAFRRFLDLVPEANAKLYLHMGLRDRGIRVLPFAADLGIQDRLLLTGFSLEHPSVTDTHLNLVYNACDVGINTADAEGWGLIALEHGATRKAQLVPAHTGCGEIWRGHAHLLAATAHFDPMHNRKAFEVKVDAAAHALAMMYRDEALRERYAALAQRKVEDHTPTWSSVGDRLATLIHPDPLGVPASISGLASQATHTVATQFA